MSRIRVLCGKRPMYTNIEINMNTNISYIFSYIFPYIFLYIPRKCLVSIVQTGMLDPEANYGRPDFAII